MLPSMSHQSLSRSRIGRWSLPRASSVLFFTTVSVAATNATVAIAEPVMAKEILSARVRKQGFVCEGPTRAVKDTERSTPGSALWLLLCDSTEYRIRLIPNMAADVELLR